MPEASAPKASEAAWAGQPWGWRDRGWLLGMALLWSAFVACTWGRWVWPTADSARELLIPFQIAQGLPLYREVSYLYGPVAPALQAFLLKAIAPRVEVLMAFNALVAFGTQAGLYTLARRVFHPGPALAVAGLAATHFMLGPDILGHLWPYAHAATFGLALGLVVLNALAAHAAGGGRGWLALAGAAGGLAVATKLEFGFGAALTLLAYGLWLAWANWAGWRAAKPQGERASALPGPSPLALAAPSLPWGGRSALAAWLGSALATLLPGLLAFGAMAWWVLGQASFAEFWAEVWPTRLMALWGSQGAWKGDAASWGANLKWLALDLGLVGLLAGLGWWLRGFKAWLGLLLGLGALAAVAGQGVGAFYLSQAAGMWYGPSFALLLGALLWAWWQGPRGGLAPAVWLLVGVYGLGVASRTLFLGLNAYSPYQAPVALLAWVGAAVLVAPWLWPRALGDPLAGAPGRAGRARVGRVALAGLALALGGQNLWARAWSYASPHQPVAGPVGVVVPPASLAAPFGQALAFAQGAMAPGEGILALPMDGDAYLFLGKPNPLKEANLYLGYLSTPEEEAAAISRLASRKVRWVWVSNYGRLRLGQDYLPGLMAFVKLNGQPAARFGGQAGAFGITLWRLKPAADWLLPPSLGGGRAWQPPEEHHDD